jgi:RNA polymerase sigma-70 factor (ECF subfamily)
LPGNIVAKLTHADLATVRKILKGDEKAFRTLFDDYFPRLYRFAMARLGGDHDASLDVAQKSLCKAIENLDRYRGEAALYTWVCQICRNTLIDHCRAKNRDAGRVVPLEDQHEIRAILDAMTGPATEEPETLAWRADLGRLIQSAMDHLTPRYADVLEWKYVDGLSVREIAARLNTGPKAAESLLGRARQAFRQTIKTMAGATDFLASEGRQRTRTEV